MRLEKFTLKGQEALQAAQNRAEALGSPMLEPEHLLEALIAQEDGIVAPLLKKLGVPIESVRAELDRYLTSQPKVEGAQVSLSPKLDKVFQQAVKESEQFRDEYISSEHLLLALSASDTFAGKLLKKSGGNKNDILKVLASIRGNQRVTDQNAEEKYQALKRYAKDLTDLARKGKIDPVIGLAPLGPKGQILVTSSGARPGDLVVMTKSAGSFRSFPAEQKTTRCLSGNPGSGKQPSLKDSPSESWQETFRKH